MNARSQETRNRAALTVPRARVCADKAEPVALSDVIVLCVKKSAVEEVCRSLSTFPLKGKAVLSFVPGVTAERLKALLAISAVVHTMPNLPIFLCRGDIGVANACDFEDTDLCRRVMDMLGALGRTVTVGEADLEKVTVATAYGPAFAAVMLDAYHGAALQTVRSGTLAQDITLDVFEGTVAMMREMSMKEIINEVATKGGSIEAGMVHMDERTVTSILCATMTAAYDRATKKE